jgi:hypothetical protein
MFTKAVVRGFTLILAVAVAGACGGSDDDTAVDETVEAAPVTEPASAALDSVIAVTLEPLGGAGYSGTLHIEADGERTLLTATLRGAADGIHQGHLLAGRCPQPGASLERMQPVVTDGAGFGEALTVVDRPAGTLLDGNHVVTFRAADGSAVIVCGELPTL